MARALSRTIRSPPGYSAGGTRRVAVAAGRFKDNPNYLPRFYTDANFAALNTINAACDAAGISLLEDDVSMATQPLGPHAGRRPAARRVVDRTTREQYGRVRGRARRAGHRPKPLPTSVIEAIDGVWDKVPALRDGAFPYWRSYSKDMPNRESLPPGASYNAAKK